MFRFILFVSLLLAPAAPVTAGNTDTHTYNLSWSIHGDIPDGAGHTVLWIAIPQELPEQTVSELSVRTDYPWTIVEDPDFGNRVVRVTIDGRSVPVDVGLGAHVVRRAVTAPRPAKLTDGQRALYLREEALVSLSPRVRQIAEGIEDTDRARYDYVLASMDYDKTVPGWGRGDTERACEVGKGNCTDFHSLFMSLERARGVPCVFEMGYPTTTKGEATREGGYHCWAWFYNGSAWVPVDISEADKHPEKADFFFGHLDADRITFSRGRDVRLPGMQGPPLNYLSAGAYMEVDGKPSDGVTRTLSYTVDGQSAWKQPR